MIRVSIKLIFVAALVAVACGQRVARAQDEEGAEDVPNAARAAPAAAFAKMQVANIDQQVDQWVFNRFGGAAPARTKLEAALLLRIDDLDRVCSTSEAQKQKLRLAGQGDIKRFFDRVAELKRKVARVQNDPNQNIWQDVQPLQGELNAGIFGDESFFAKTVKRTLDRDQAARYEGLLAKRKLVRHRATIEWFVVHVDKALGLTETQRQQLIELLVAVVPPPDKFGLGDYWYLMLQSAKVPEEKIKPIFDAPQWRLLSRQFIQAKGMEQWLKQNGIMPADRAGHDHAEAAPPQPVMIRAVPLMPAAKVAAPAKPITTTKD
jgi:hypothetical protein